jgi:hypothetical protein
MAARAEWLVESSRWWLRIVLVAAAALVAWGVVLVSHWALSSSFRGGPGGLMTLFTLVAMVSLLVLGLSVLIGVISLAFASPLTHELRARLWLQHAWMTNLPWLLPLMIWAMIAAARAIYLLSVGTNVRLELPGIVACLFIPAWGVVCWMLYARWGRRLQGDYDRIGLDITATRRNEVAFAIAMFAVWAIAGCFGLFIQFIMIGWLTE